mmetsp:Transcript_4881/g.15763  ORF Transcript_4881/g.15763 Transcript_4881/m.15763 type:complete len:205 (+) Transcript_4881:1108-1722(+)
MLVHRGDCLLVSVTHASNPRKRALRGVALCSLDCFPLVEDGQLQLLHRVKEWPRHQAGGHRPQHRVGDGFGGRPRKVYKGRRRQLRQPQFVDVRVDEAIEVSAGQGVQRLVERRAGGGRLAGTGHNVAEQRSVNRRRGHGDRLGRRVHITCRHLVGLGQAHVGTHKVAQYLTFRLVERVAVSSGWRRPNPGPGPRWRDDDALLI